MEVGLLQQKAKQAEHIGKPAAEMEAAELRPLVRASRLKGRYQFLAQSMPDAEAWAKACEEARITCEQGEDLLLGLVVDFEAYKLKGKL